VADASHWGQKASALSLEGRDEEAEAVLRDGLRALPGHPVLQYALATRLLAREAYDEGWPLYESRSVMPKGPRAPRLSFPQWRGEPIRSLVVLPEQGFGDQILFSRYVPPLLAQGVRVTLVATPNLARLFAPLGAEILAVDGAVSLPRADAWCFMGSLPFLTCTTLFEPHLPRGAGGGGVGLMTRGGPDWHDQRSLSPELAGRLAHLGRSLHPDDTGMRDFAQTARLIGALDLVITIDTSVANLAGSMGKPVWVLLHDRPDWRWGPQAQTARMFPSARLFRQPAAGDWPSVIENVLEAHADLRL
jgi:hypothetical protein